MKTRHWLVIGVATSALVLVGCGKKDHEEGDNHSEHAEGEDAGGVTFKEGSGLLLSPEVIKALGVRTVEAEERSVAAEITITAQIFATKPKPLASTHISAEQAEAIRDASYEGAKLLRIDRSTVEATRLLDAVFELDSIGSRQLGDFVSITIRGKTSNSLAVPRSAVLESATGTFVYVVNGNAYLRTPVKLGARAGEYTEILEGVYAGDVVVASPVEQLWLAELRLTKGGGHSH